MSLLTIEKNKDKIEKYIRDKKVTLENKSTSFVVGSVLSECLVAQYKMKRNYLNKNMLRKRLYKEDCTAEELKDSIYQHIYMHNHIGMEDEIYETKDAIEYFFKYQNADLLIVEEFIDVFHFIMDYTISLEEHYYFTLIPDELFTTTNLVNLYTGDNDYGKFISRMIQVEGFHISSYIFNMCMQDIKYFDTMRESTTELNSLNREFIRNTNFKDWKKYPKDYFYPTKFSELFDINRKMYIALFNGLSNCAETVQKLLDNKHTFKGDNLGDILLMMFGIYMAKREENIRRQLNDPRYTGREEGEIVGTKVR